MYMELITIKSKRIGTELNAQSKLELITIETRHLFLKCFNMSTPIHLFLPIPLSKIGVKLHFYSLNSNW